MMKITLREKLGKILPEVKKISTLGPLFLSFLYHQSDHVQQMFSKSRPDHDLMSTCKASASVSKLHQSD